MWWDDPALWALGEPEAAERPIEDYVFWRIRWQVAAMRSPRTAEILTPLEFDLWHTEVMLLRNRPDLRSAHARANWMADNRPHWGLTAHQIRACLDEIGEVLAHIGAEALLDRVLSQRKAAA